MIRKDSALDADRPHYYSQYWIDVAAGKRDGGQRAESFERESEPESLEDLMAEPPMTGLGESDAEFEAEPLPILPKKPAPKKAEPKKAEPSRSSLSSFADLAKIDLMMRDSAAMGDDTVPDIEAAPTAEEAIVTDFDVNAAGTGDEPVAAAEEEAGEFPNEGFDEEEEDDWGGGGEPRRGSKPNKRRREPRRDF